MKNTRSLFGTNSRRCTAVPATLALLAVGVPLLAGCGGGGHTTSATGGTGTPASAAAQGRLALTVVWPAEDTRPGRKIPSNTDSLSITLTTTDGVVVVNDTIDRPDSLPGFDTTARTYTTTYIVPPGEYFLKCDAKAVGITLASGTTKVNVTSTDPAAPTTAALDLKFVAAISGGLAINGNLPALLVATPGQNTQTLTVVGKDARGGNLPVDYTKVVWYVSDKDNHVVDKDGNPLLNADGSYLDPNDPANSTKLDAGKVDITYPLGANHQKITITAKQSTLTPTLITPPPPAVPNQPFYLTARYEEGTDTDTVLQSFPRSLTVTPVFQSNTLAISPATLNQGETATVSITASGATANDAVVFTLGGNALSPLNPVTFSNGTFSTTFNAPALPGAVGLTTLPVKAVLNGDTTGTVPSFNQATTVSVKSVGIALPIIDANLNLDNSTSDGSPGKPYLVNAGEAVVTLKPTISGISGTVSDGVTIAITSGTGASLSASSVLSGGTSGTSLDVKSGTAVTFTAPYTPGLFEITATSKADPTKTAVRYIQVPTGKVNITLH